MGGTALYRRLVRGTPCSGARASSLLSIGMVQGALGIDVVRGCAIFTCDLQLYTLILVPVFRNASLSASSIKEAVVLYCLVRILCTVHSQYTDVCVQCTGVPIKVQLVFCGGGTLLSELKQYRCF